MTDNNSDSIEQGLGAIPGSRERGQEVVPALTGFDPARIRPEVLAFACLMERELCANDHKSGWKNNGVNELTDRLLEEAGELERSVVELLRQIIWADEPKYGSRGGNGWSRIDAATRAHQVGIGYCEMQGEKRQAQMAKIVSEAADVANFAMMIADVCGALAIATAAGTDETRSGSAEGKGAGRSHRPNTTTQPTGEGSQ